MRAERVAQLDRAFRRERAELGGDAAHIGRPAHDRPQGGPEPRDPDGVVRRERHPRERHRDLARDPELVVARRRAHRRARIDQ